MSQDEEPGWAAIVHGIRAHALRQPPAVARELLEWADLFEGIAQLHGGGPA